MSIKWTFCPSSEPYLQRCIAAAPPPDVNNKWFQKFGKKDFPQEPAIEMHENTDDNLKTPPIHEKNNETTTTYEDFFDKIEHDSTVPVLYVLQECAKNPSLVTLMAEKCSINAVGQIFEYIFSNKDADREAIFTFITNFLPAYLKLRCSRECNDVLMKTSCEFPEIFKQLLEKIINDIEIPNQVLNDYISSLNEELVTSLMKTLNDIVITPQGFSSNISSIHTAYKNCIKTEGTQNYVQKMLIKHSKSCSADKNFGRLFLTFLHTEKSMGRKRNIKMLEECLEVHSSMFKRPCLVLLKQIVDE